MSRLSNRHGAIWTSAAVVIALGVPAAVFANSISSALTGERPNWVYATAALLLIIATIEGTYIYFLNRELDAFEGQSREVGELLRPLGTPVSLAEVIGQARRDVLFVGISSKRSISDDRLRRILSTGASQNVTLRVLLLDPACDAFAARAREEHESAETWKLEHQAALQRMRELKSKYDADIRLRISSEYPIWRVMIADGDRIWVNPFLPGVRGTEANQWHMVYPVNQLSYGIIRTAERMWSDAKEMPL